MGARGAWAIGCDVGGTTLRVVARDAAGRTRRRRGPVVPPHALPARLRTALSAWAIRPDQVAALVVDLAGRVDARGAPRGDGAAARPRPPGARDLGRRGRARRRPG